MLAEIHEPKALPTSSKAMPLDGPLASPFRFSPVTDDDRKGLEARMLFNFSGHFVPFDESPLIPWCGMLEFELISVLILDHRVDRIEGRPLRVSVVVDGKEVSRIPAFRLTMGYLKVSVDVAATEKSDGVTAAVREAYGARGEAYCVVPRREIQAQPRLRNARLVLGYRRHRPDGNAEIAVLSQVSRPGRHTVRSLRDALPDRTDVRETVFAMCTRRHLAVDLRAADPLDMAVSMLPSKKWLP